MKKFIEVHDNIISLELANRIEHLLIGGEILDFKYVYQPNIVDENIKGLYAPGFSHVFTLNNKQTFLPELTPFSFSLNQILYTFCNSQSILIKNIFQARAFLQLPIQSKPKKPGIHIDMSQPHWVCLYYVNDSDGETIFFDDNENEIKRITPKKGRIAFFNGNIPHSASLPTNNTRAVLNFDFLGEYLDKQK